jgi:2-(1,2-epoxy-1,2-dihydrophenyl)acetyl-CoA isomerase
MAVTEQQQTLETSTTAGVAWVRLNRPERMNAIDAGMRRELDATLKKLERDAEVRCVVLTGNGRAFSAGADVKEFGVAAGATAEQLAAEVGRILRQEYIPIVTRLRTMPKPVIAAVNGVAAGIGASLAMASDIRIAVPEASFIEAFVGIALAPDGGATWFLPRLIGTGKALEMFFTGAPLAAADAERFGLVNHIVSADQLEGTARALAERLAAGPPRAIAAAKRAVNHALESGLEESMEFESYLQEAQVVRDDFREGVMAFIEKREAKFTGK